MTANRARKTDGNGIPRPVVKWRKGSTMARAKCRQCVWSALYADLALARQHVKVFPDHRVELTTAAVTEVWAETTDGQSWVEAVNAL